MDALDCLLGPGVVTVGDDGFFELDLAALAAQLHRRDPGRGERCWCPACRFAREHAPEPAPEPAAQPWEPKPARAA